MPVNFQIVGVGLRVVAAVTQILLVQDVQGISFFPMGPPLEGETPPVAAVRIVQSKSGWQGTALPGLTEQITSCDGAAAVGSLVINCASVQAPQAGLTAVWRTLAQASVDLLTGRNQRDAAPMILALTRMVHGWDRAAPGP